MKFCVQRVLGNISPEADLCVYMNPQIACYDAVQIFFRRGQHTIFFDNLLYNGFSKYCRLEGGYEMLSINARFESFLNDAIKKYSGKTLIFFKGFAISQIQQLITHPNAIISNSDLLKENYLNLDALDDAWIDVITSIKMANGPLVGFYEELLAIRQILSKIKVEKIVVIENNILSPWAPCYYPQAYAIKLFDYWQEEHEPRDKIITMLSQYYGDVKLINDHEALLLPATLDDELIETVPFWSGDVCLEEPNPDVEQIEVGSIRDWQYCLAFTQGMFTPALFLYDGCKLSARHQALFLAAKSFDVNVYFDELDLYKEKIEYDDSQFVPILKKYWGSSASFRPLLFYRNPDFSRDTEILSQGQIIAEIVDQCENAYVGDAFSNIFITAPTGSGKSILFQIPALYLAEKYNLVTIVVSPLIALMNDQVDQLQRERGISTAACINSTMSMEERSSIIDRIHSGKISLLYLAPELLLTTHLQAFLGGRKIGMVVIDEAHTVTSWGRDFRSDYWFLGDFLRKAARDGLKFPVLCLTATAVYSGEDDVVNDTIRELGLEKAIIHLGNVKRENIEFDIQLHNPKEVETKIETAKIDMTMKRMHDYISRGEKVLTYFPYRSQVDQIYNLVPASDHIKVRRYHGQIPAPERKLVERDYKLGTAMGLFCTKAFGMGIDVGDIKHVIHFAPTGTLSDYVQEIGRAARNPNIHGIAHIDFFPGDLRYVRSLNGISEMRQYQLREMLKKISSIQRAKKRRNLLISAETFEYLFKENEVENRTKSGLMLLAKDLSNKYTFPILVVRPKAMLSKNYVNVPAEVEDQFLKQYGAYVQFQEGVKTRTVAARGPGASDVTVYSTGNTFLVDMAAIWENCYPDRAFGMFKKEFFERNFFAGDKSYNVSPRVRVEIRYTDEYTTVVQRTQTILTALTDIFEKFKNGEVKQFTQRQLETELTELLGEKVLPHDKMGLLLDVFTESVDENAAYSQNRSQIRVLRKRKQAGADESIFFVSSVAYARLPNYFSRQLDQCSPNHDDNVFFRFYPLTQNKQIEIMPTLRVLELLGLATYEIRGGEKAEVFIRINDPDKIERLANSGKYTNRVLQSIQEHHRSNEQLLAAFFAANISTAERWELIEQYFLGNEDLVRQKLNINT